MTAVMMPAALWGQESAPPREKERISVVAISAGRLGLLIPINDRWMLRPDLRTFAFSTTDGGPGINSDAQVYGGLSLIRRSAPVNGSWVYGSLRYGLFWWGDLYGEPGSVTHALTLTAGAHGRLTDWLSVFGEAGPAFSYAKEINVGSGDAVRDFDLVSRIGIAMQMPRPDAPRVPPDPSRTIPREGERPSWIVGGFGTGGLLLPLSDRTALRPDLALSLWSQEPFTGTQASAGVSLLRRFRASDEGWTFGAVRYGLDYSQQDAFKPSWAHHLSLTVGGHARLRGRLGVMAEAGADFRYTEVHAPSGLVVGRLANMIQRVGLTYRWNDR